MRSSFVAITLLASAALGSIAIAQTAPEKKTVEKVATGPVKPAKADGPQIGDCT